MRTIKRSTPEIDTGIDNYSKYLNQMTFKGILEDDNIYTVDQESFRDAQNVYVNSEQRLVSRPTLQRDNIPDGVIPLTYTLIDVINVSIGTVYVSENSDKVKSIIFHSNNGQNYILEDQDEFTLNLDNKYHTDIRITNTEDIYWNIYGRDNVGVQTTGIDSDSYYLVPIDDRYKDWWTVWFNFNLAGGKITVEQYNDKYNMYPPMMSPPIEPSQIITLDTKVQNYHISVIDHYIICFNNVGAKVIDGNNIEAGWQDFNNFVEIPVIKSVVGNTETTYPNNIFTDAYKEQYIWSNESQPIISSSGKADIETFSPEGNYKYSINNAEINTDYQIVRPVKLTDEQMTQINTNNISIEKDIICISYSNRFDISFTKGDSFTTVYYPAEIDDPLLKAMLSKDGEYVFIVNDAGIYRCNLGDFTWSAPITLKDNEKIIGSIYQQCSYFMTGDIFCFISILDSDESPSEKMSMRLYFKGPGLYAGSNYEQGNNVFSYTDNIYTNWQNAADGYLHTNNLLDFISTSENNTININGLNINMCLITGLQGEEATAISICGDSTSDRDTAQASIVTIIGGNNPFATVDMGYMFSDRALIDSSNFRSFVGFKLEQIYNTPSNWNFSSDDYQFTLGVAISGLGNISSTTKIHLHEITYCTFIYYITSGSFAEEYKVASVDSNINALPELQNDYNYTLDILPKKLTGGYIHRATGSVGDEYSNIFVYSNISKQWTPIVKEFDPEIDIVSNEIFYTTGDKFYITTRDNILLTNDFRDSDSAIITFTTNANSKFTKVPTISYSDTELYLAFDNLLQITNNARDGVDILFNLPAINDQSFINTITAMVNISTTEVALFFLDKVVICSKQEDTNLDQGFRYDYYNTKLSTGVRLGDSVINTLEGSYTVFPTRRGLAIMNYQAFMATTDQVIQYITDGVQKMWDSFFNNSEQIKIIQWRNKLVLTNNTKTLLLYDLTNTAWWRWELPENVLKTLTDQISLRTVNDTLCIFKDATQYYDFSEIGDFREIDWYVQSQPLHMNAPNYYKNLKQLIFQMFNDKDTIEKQSLMVQIKLYRKRITIRDPETVEFKIDNLRTFVKRFNYWKINEVQWGLGNDTTTNTPAKLEFNGITIKYELGEEVR